MGYKRRAFTLIEVLVVIALISILFVMMVPRLRMISTERKAREAARVVASTMALSTQRAQTEGISGVYLERNRNFVATPPTNRGLNGQPIAVPYAVNRLYLMQSVVSYSGDFSGDQALVQPAGPDQVSVTIPRPLGQTGTGSGGFIGERDSIFLEGRSFGYSVATVEEDDPTPSQGYPNGHLTLGIATSGSAYQAVLPTSLPAPAAGHYPFRVERVPRQIPGSMVELPAGYIVDLRYSGWPANSSYPESAFARLSTTDDEFVKVFFGSHESSGWQSAGWAQYGTGQDPCSAATVQSVPEQETLPGTVYFLVTKADPDPGSTDPLTDPDSLWVTVDPQSGIVNVADNVPQPPAVIDSSTGEETAQSFARRLRNARRIARTRRSALQ